MGQKVNPISFRTGVTQPWQSRWFAEGREFKKLLIEDVRLRRVLERRFSLAGIESVEIERLPKSVKTRLRVSRPGVVIGRGGAGIEEARRFILESLGFKTGDRNAPKIEVSVEQINEPELSAKLVAQRIVSDLERRLPQRRVVSKTMDRVMAAGAKGIKIALSGRIGGSEIARHEKYQKGSMPTQSLRATIDYASVPALLKRGYVGIKVWIHRKKENATA